MIPAWDEKAVIFRMLLNTVATVDYRNYHIFVGTYPNDEATKMEVEKAREIYPNIDVIVTPSDGPTNKADCLNWLSRAYGSSRKTTTRGSISSSCMTRRISSIHFP